MVSYDVAVIGAGHNGLIAASYLAKSGLSVGLFEERDEPGGGLYTEPFDDNPEFLRNNHAVNLNNIRNAPFHRDLQLERHGAELIDPPVKVGMPLQDGRALVLYEDPHMTKRSIAQFSEADAERYEELYYEWNRMANQIQRPEWYTPPRSMEERRAQYEDTELGRKYLDIVERAPIDVLRDNFENEHVLGLFASLVQATGAQPFQQGIDGTLIRAWNGNHFMQISRGGSATYACAIANCFEAAGGDLHLGNRVTSVLVEDRETTGIELDDGTTVEADAVVSNVHYPQTYLDLVGREHLSESYVSSIEDEYELMEGGLYGAHLALEEAPEFEAADDNPDVNQPVKFTAGIETPEDLLREKDSIRSGQLPDDPPMMGGALSTLDPTQAPDDNHTTYLWTHTPWDLEGGGPEQWDEVEYDFLDACVDHLADYAPNVDDAIVEAYSYSPLDIQRTHRNMIEGSRSGGSYSPDQLMEKRPDYSGPIDGLYLSGSPVHPGGSITGAPGYNCAGIVVDDLGIEKWWNPPEVSP